MTAAVAPGLSDLPDLASPVRVVTHKVVVEPMGA
ncbi:hypothetical protein ATKI12_3736 [Kitasatospora sp. Ki12]